MSYHSADWPYTDPHQSSQQSQGRRQSHSLYGLHDHQPGMAFADPFAQQHSGLSVQTGNLPGGHQMPESATTPTPYGPSVPGESMNRFLSQRESPWTVAHLASPSLNTAAAQGAIQHQAFNTPRSPARSDTASFVTGPTQQDSAYCSNASPTVPEPAYANQDCPEITDMFNGMKYASSDSPSTPVKTRRAPTSIPSNADEGSITLPEDGKCTFCQVQPRLKSELKKHMLRHIRPFRCKIPDCNGANEGFTTKNDLDRHNRSVHGIFPQDAKVYICAAKNCAEGEKTWPRYDNFKQHCERMHKSDNLDALINRSERAAPPPSQAVQQLIANASRTQAERQQPAISDTASIPPNDAMGFDSLNPQNYDMSELYGGSETSSFVNYPHLDNYNEDPGAKVAHRVVRNQLQNSNPSFRNDDAASYSSARHSSQGSRSVSGRPLPDVVVHQAGNQKQRMNQDLAHMFPSQSEDMMDPRATQMQQQIVNDQNAANNYLTPNSASFGRSRSVSSHSSGSPARHQRVRSATVPDSEMPTRLTVGKRKSADASNASVSSKRVRCKWPGCNKAGMRPCELKKHERRHSRPFGCTFDFCNKAFGSKNDWKRHESSQHFQEEMWRCNQPYQPGTDSSTVIQSDLERTTPCGQVFYERKDLMTHLSGNHQLRDEEIKQTCESQRIGRNLQGTFWCGFCKEVVRLHNEGRKGWDERFDHIGRHFHPGEKKIQDWLPAIGGKTKGQLLAQKAEEAESFDDEEEEPEQDDDSEAVESPSIEITDSYTGSDALGISNNSTRSTHQVDRAAVDQFTQPLDRTRPPLHQKRGSHDRVPQDETLGELFCCTCATGPFNANFMSGMACVNCGHACEQCFGRAKRAKLEPMEE